MEISGGWLREATRRPSPNCDARPPPAVVDLLVVHGISLPPGEYGGPWIDALFTNSLNPEAHPYFRDISQLRVSAHVLIRRGGEAVQYVPFHLRAWHAGKSSFAGRPFCNDYSIGVELEGTDQGPYAEGQYRRLADLVLALQREYPAITRDRIVGHSDIAPGRKTDPGPSFEWPRLRVLLGGRP
jgi:N-acetyl-anhydromuramoyl-L-alanine amidase